MKKTKLFRLLFVLAVATALIAATAAAVSAASVNKNDADYKYEYTNPNDDGVKISFTDKNILTKRLLRIMFIAESKCLTVSSIRNLMPQMRRLKVVKLSCIPVIPVSAGIPEKSNRSGRLWVMFPTD